MKTLLTYSGHFVLIAAQMPRHSRTCLVYNRDTQTVERREHKGNEYLKIGDKPVAILKLATDAVPLDLGERVYYTPGYRDGKNNPHGYDTQQIRKVSTYEEARDKEIAAGCVSIEAANGEHKHWHRKILAATATDLGFPAIEAPVVEALLGVKLGTVVGEIFSLDVVTKATVGSIPDMRYNTQPSKYRVVLHENFQRPHFQDWPDHYGEPTQASVDAFRKATNQSFSATGAFAEISRLAGRVINYHTATVFLRTGGEKVAESKAAMFEVLE